MAVGAPSLLCWREADCCFSDARKPKVNFLHSWPVVLPIFLGKLFLSRRTVSNYAKLVASRCVKRENASLSVYVRRSQTPLLKLDSLPALHQTQIHELFLSSLINRFF